MQINHWTSDDGFSTNSILCLTQDHNGFIWMGLESGICRFDGVKFVEFNRENTPSLKVGLFSVAYTDRNGRVWFGSRGGGAIYYEKGVFTHITTTDGLAGNEIWTLMESGDGTIWLGTCKGLNIWRDGRISTIELPDRQTQHNIRALLEDSRGRIWVGSRNTGLFRLTKQKSGYEAEFLGKKDLICKAILEDRSGAVWLGTTNKGIRVFRDNSETIYSEPQLPENRIQTLCEDNSGNIWIGTNKNGLSVVPAGETIPFKYSHPGDLPSENILSVIEDKEQSLWVGCDFGGLAQIRETRLMTYTSRDGLSRDTLYGVYCDRDGRIWAGTAGFGVNVMSPENILKNRFTVPENLKKFTKDYLMPMVEHPAGSMWFGSMGSGAIHLEKGHAKIYNSQNGLNDDSVHAIFADSSGTIWIGTDTGGLHHIKNNHPSLVLNLQYRINVIYQDRSGRYYIGLFGNGFRVMEHERLIPQPLPEELANDVVFFFHEDNNSIIWIGTMNNGLYGFKGGRFVSISQRKGMPDHCIYSIQTDKKNRFWLSSNRGIICVHQKELTDIIEGRQERVEPLLLGKANGMKNRECNGGSQSASCRSLDGRLWFPTVAGLTVLDPENIDINPLPPPVSITSFIADKVFYSACEPISAPPGRGDLEFSYTAASFKASHQLVFKYRLEGYDKDWIWAERRRTAYYTNIPPGNYRFRVIAANSDGVWNQTGAELSFRLNAHFYTRPWFILLTLLMLTGTGLTLNHIFRNILRVRILRRKGQRNIIGVSDDEADKILRKMIFLIEHKQLYRNSDLSLQTLSELLKINPRYLSNIINERLKKSFFELINEHRIKEAQQLLITRPAGDEKSILEISYDVGFNSKSAFNRAFKLFTGVTPTEYKKRANNPPIN